MLNYLNRWMGQLKWQRLAPFEKLAATLLKHVRNGIANYCETKVRFGVVEGGQAGNIRMPHQTAAEDIRTSAICS